MIPFNLVFSFSIIYYALSQRDLLSSIPVLQDDFWIFHTYVLIALHPIERASSLPPNGFSKVSLDELMS